MPWLLTHMEQQRALAILSILMLVAVCLVANIRICSSSEELELEFEVMDFGSISGYSEESYLVVRTATEWIDIWQRHMGSRLSPPEAPDVDFTEKMVICCFMGERPTAGFSMSISRIYVYQELMYVEIIKSGPPEDFFSATVITCPYVFVTLEKTELNIIFNVSEEDGSVNEHVLPEFPLMAFLIFGLLSISIVAGIHLQRKKDARTTNYLAKLAYDLPIPIFFF
ncbi:MAG: protease complex subunit PrcB family protein [Candidatus Bathyarchaeota archaeon]|nr:MAG: protease complex subunit PrcB family protein [Candidatus Bathyarchaeota archaeon]